MAVIVPGIGDGTNLCDDWIPEARTSSRRPQSTAVVLWKGYDNPVDILAAAAGSIECNEDLVTAGQRPDGVRGVARSRARSSR